MGRSDVTFGSDGVGRRPADLAGSDGMIGLLINTLPLRLQLDPRERTADLLVRLQREQAGLLEHQHLGLAEIQRLVGQGELFDTLTVFENYPLDKGLLSWRAAGLRIARATGWDATHYALSLLALPGERLRLRLGYRPELSARAVAIAACMGRVLEQLARHPERRLWALEVLPDAERAQVVEAWNATERAVAPTTLAALLEAQAARSAEAVALVGELASLSYGALNRRANRLAHALIARGVGPEDLVGIALPRSPEMVVSLLAVTKAGAAWLPLDPDYPPERLRLMVADARPVCLLTRRGLVAELAAERVELDAPDSLLAGMPDTNPTDAERRTALDPHHPAYVIYTSGSTGTPKGVVVSHANVANLVGWATDFIGSQALKRVLGSTSLNFDVSVFELMTPLSSGGSVEIVRDLLAVAETEVGWAGGVISGVPSVFAPLVGPDAPALDTMLVALAGEALKIPLVEAIRAKLSQSRIVNIYGPTEATVYATAGTAGNVLEESIPDWLSDLEHADLCAGRGFAPGWGRGCGGAVYCWVGAGAGLSGSARSDRGAVCGLPVWRRRASGCIARAIWRAGVLTGCWSFSAVPMSRSSCAAFASSRARSRRCWRAMPG